MTNSKILVVEDDDDLRERLAEVLREEDYLVDTAATGLQALDRARSACYDLVITDIRMAGMDGLQALEQVKLEQPDVYSLVITGYSTEADSIRAIRLGVGEYLKKPFQLDDLLTAVERLCHRRKQIAHQRDQEESLRQAVRLALETLARSVAPEGLIGMATLADRLARHLGLSANTAEAVQLATLVGGLQQFSPDAGTGALLATLSTDIRRIVAEALDPADLEEIDESLAAQIVRLCLGRLGPETRTERVAPALESALQEVLRSAVPEARSHAPPTGPQSLLSLARTLAYAGDGEAAERGFREVLQLAPGPDQEASAWLGLASLAHLGRRWEEVREAALQATARADLLTPLAQAQTWLQAGMLLASQAAEEGRDFLERARQLYRSAGDTTGYAQSVLALGRRAGLVWDDEHRPDFELHLSLLLRPENRQDLASCGYYLLPWLLECAGTPALPSIQKALKVMARDFPRELERCLTQGQLAPRARVVLAEAFAEHPSSQPASSCLGLLSADAAPEVRAAAVPLGETLPPLLRLYSFGTFEAYWGEQRVAEKAWRGHNSRYLLARLAAGGGTPLSVDILMSVFWGEEVEPDKARKRLNWTVAALRKTLRPEGWAGELECVERVDSCLMMSPGLQVWHDFSEFHRHLEAARSEGPASLEHLRQALKLYRGPYLEGCYMDWAIQFRDEVERKVLDALRRLVQASLTGGEPMQALEYSHRLLQIDDCCQEAYLAAMQANLALGRAESAVRLYEVATRRLRRELGMDPSIELMREHQRALISLSAVSGASG